MATNWDCDGRKPPKGPTSDLKTMHASHAKQALPSATRLPCTTCTHRKHILNIVATL